jgi:hypothetical protein
MDIMNIIGIMGVIITIISLIYAIYTNRQLERLKDYNRELAWEIYRKSSLALGHYQKIQSIKVSNRDIIESVGRGELISQELLTSSIRMIKRFEKKYDDDIIEKWHKEGKLRHETHVTLFKSFI